MYSLLSPHEEQEILAARGACDPTEHTQLDISSDLGGFSGLPMYQQTVYKSTYDFGSMEAFAADEKRRLGIAAPSYLRGYPLASTSTGAELRRRLALASEQPYSGGSGPTGEILDLNGDDGPRDSNIFAQKRQRKLSQSHPHPRRQGKLALFEGNSGPPPPSLMPPTSHRISFANGPTTSIVPPHPGVPAPSPSPEDTGHDRPYRFSFYSNANSATIHARSLSELPAEGQTFEELFMGRGGEADTRSATPVGRKTPAPAHTPQNSEAGGGAKPKESLLAKAANGRISNEPSLGGFTTLSRTEAPHDPDINTWWLDITCPTDEEMRMLTRVFGIHPLTAEDIQMEETREKIELFRNYYFVCFRSFDQDIYSPTHLEPLNMYIIVFREGTLSFHFRGTPHPQNVRRRIKQLKDYISVTSDWISYALIDDITDAFGPLIQNIEYEVDSIDELVLILKETEQSDMLRRIGTCRKKVMGLLRLMGNKADVVKGLAKRCNENWSVAPKSDIGLYLSDIQDHLITMTQNLNHYEKILSRSHSNYLAQISIEMTDANNQINDVLSKLTALGTVLVPMNLVTGLWGMNVHVPGQDIEEGYTWFLGIIGALVGFAIIGSILTYKLLRSA
ncbi:CorA metal ion transporter [Tulasnella sp. 419]|nr:CorA metal ion transporter [Tulasnella sp. 419]